MFKDDKLNDNGDEVVDNNNIGNERNEKLKKLLVQKKDLYNLYKFLDNKKMDFKDNYPTRSVKSYFEKYTKKDIPILNVENGSNIHGFLDDFQHITKKNDISKVAESSYYLKRELMTRRRFGYGHSLDNKKFDINTINDLDNRISNLHYQFAEDILM